MVVKQSDINQILSTRNGKIHKSIISLILSSGMTPQFVRHLTLNQLLDSCKHYEGFDGQPTLDELLDSGLECENFIPCFDIGTAKSPRITCCTPEALHLILDYIDRYREVSFNSNDEPIFLNSDHTPLTKHYVSDKLGEMNKEVGRGHRKYGFSRVTASGLVARFKDICERYLEGDFAEEAIDLMKGSSSARNRRFYNEVCNDRDILINHYRSISDCLYLMPNPIIVERRRNRLNYTTNRY